MEIGEAHLVEVDEAGQVSLAGLGRPEHTTYRVTFEEGGVIVLEPETLLPQRDKELMRRIAEDRGGQATIEIGVRTKHQLELIQQATGLPTLDEVVRVVITEWRDRIAAEVDKERSRST